MRFLIRPLFLLLLMGIFEISAQASSSTPSSKNLKGNSYQEESISIGHAEDAEGSCAVLSGVVDQCRNTLNFLRTFKPQNHPSIDQAFYQNLFQKAELAIAKLSTVQRPSRTGIALIERCQTLLEVLQDIVDKARSEAVEIEMPGSSVPMPGYITTPKSDAALHRPIMRRSKNIPPKEKLANTEKKEVSDAEQFDRASTIYVSSQRRGKHRFSKDSLEDFE